MSRTNHDRTAPTGQRLTLAGDPRSIRRTIRVEYRRMCRADAARAARLEDRRAISESLSGME